MSLSYTHRVTSSNKHSHQPGRVNLHFTLALGSVCVYVCVCEWMREVFVATINLMKVARLSNKELIITICFRPMKSHKLSQTKSEHTTIFQFISEICLLWMIDKQVICSCSCSLLNYEMVFVGPITRAPLAFNAKRRWSVRTTDHIESLAVSSLLWRQFTLFYMLVVFFFCSMLMNNVRIDDDQNEIARCGAEHAIQARTTSCRAYTIHIVSRTNP